MQKFNVTDPFMLFRWKIAALCIVLGQLQLSSNSQCTQQNSMKATGFVISCCEIYEPP